MNAARSGIIALTCSWLLLAAVSPFAQTHSKTTAAYPNKAAIASYGNVPASWLQYLRFSPNPAQEWSKSPSSNVPSLRHPAYSLGQVLPVSELAASGLPSLRDMDFSSDQPQENAQEQSKPNPSNEPSLQGLGFPPNEIQGNTNEQALLDKRSHMLQIHQKLGLLAAIPMVAAIITGPGAKGHHGLPGSPTGRDVHAGLGILTTGLYFSSAYFAIRAPKIPETKSYGLIRLHKAMAWIHGPGMILTPILGSIAFSQLSRGERVHGIAKYHAWAAYTTAAAYGVAILSVTLSKHI